MICDTETLKTFTQTTDSFFMPLKNLKNKQTNQKHTQYLEMHRTWMKKQ